MPPEFEFSKPNESSERNSVSAGIYWMGLGGRDPNERQQLKSPLVNASTTSTAAEADTSGIIRQFAVEFTSSLTASISGISAMSLTAASRGKGLAYTLPIAMVTGAIVKYGTKQGLEQFIPENERTANVTDLAWGAVDAVAGVGASAVESSLGNAFLRNIGRKAIGKAISDESAELAGKQLVRHEVLSTLRYHVARGTAGGAAGSLIWSAPHRTAENWNELQTNPTAALTKIGYSTFQDAALGTALGGAIAGGGTVIYRGSSLAGAALAKARGEKGISRVNIYHLNDFHSNTDQLPLIKTRLDDLRSRSTSKGIPSEFVVAGDVESGHVNFTYTQGGKVENVALVQMGATKIIPGNHPYDAPGGIFDVPRYPRVMTPILADNPQVSLIASNLDVSAYPEYQAILKPYAVETLHGAKGPVTIGYPALITEEGAIGHINVLDARQQAEKMVRELNAQGVKNIIFLNHMGLNEDIAIAQHLINKNLKVAGIVSAHSHDFTATPIWVTAHGPSTIPFLGLKKLLPPSLNTATEGGTFSIPIMQAGSSGRWLSEFSIALTPDGIADRFRTTGTLHPITHDIVPDAALKASIDAQLSDVNKLRAIEYNATATRNYSLRGARERETALANLIADAIYDGTQKRLGITPDVVMVHSGGIRSDIFANKPLTRLDLANVFMNAGKVEGEIKELALINMTGKQIKASLEYGVRERMTMPKPTVTSRLRSLFSEDLTSTKTDLPGNFVQTSGMKYSMDLSKPPMVSATTGERISNIQIKNSAGQWVPIDENATYKVVTRFHPIDKWHQFGLFGPGTLQDAHTAQGVQPLRLSQVDLLGDYIQGKTLDPRVHSKVEGRIKDATPREGKIPVRVGVSVPTVSGVSAEARVERTEKK